MDVCRNGLHQFFDAAATAQQLNLFLRHCGEDPDALEPEVHFGGMQRELPGQPLVDAAF